MNQGTEDLSAMQIRAVSEKIWNNFLSVPNEGCFYDLQESDEKAFIPEKILQIGIINKIKKSGGISNLRLGKRRIFFNVHKEEFNSFRRVFQNPQTAFSSYRISNAKHIILPAGTDWEHITIKFLNGNDVRIKLRNDSTFSIDTTYNEMGFRDSKRKLPNKQWTTLVAFAENGGSIFWESKSINDPKIVGKLKAQKGILSKRLKAYFSLTEDPFFKYNTKDGYKLKMKLIPENLIGLRKQNVGENKYSDLEDYCNEQASVIYEEGTEI
jgi:hypothetical protein